MWGPGVTSPLDVWVVKGEDRRRRHHGPQRRKPVRTTSTFSSDIAYSERPAALRASSRVPYS